jgi:hypothetical protein
MVRKSLAQHDWLFSTRRKEKILQKVSAEPFALTAKRAILLRKFGCGSKTNFLVTRPGPSLSSDAKKRPLKSHETVPSNNT